MTQPSQFINTSDYASLKNDAFGVVTVTVPAGTNVAGTSGSIESYVEFHTDIILGQQGAIARATIQDSLDTSGVYPVNTASFTNTGIVGGVGGNIYSTYAFMYRTNPTTIRCDVYITNPYSTTLTTSSTETITFSINTFVPPFS